MPSRPRFVIPGAAQHLTQRGNKMKAVFLCPGDRRLYLEILGPQALRRGVHIVGLMTNHVHLIAVPGNALLF
jgi:putative transposase